MSDEKGLPYPPDKGATHWDGCYRGRRHHNCAIERVDRLEAELREARAEIERLRVTEAGKCHECKGTGEVELEIISGDGPIYGPGSADPMNTKLVSRYCEECNGTGHTIHGPHTEGET